MRLSHAHGWWFISYRYSVLSVLDLYECCWAWVWGFQMGTGNLSCLHNVDMTIHGTILQTVRLIEVEWHHSHTWQVMKYHMWWCNMKLIWKQSMPAMLCHMWLTNDVYWIPSWVDPWPSWIRGSVSVKSETEISGDNLAKYKQCVIWCIDAYVCGVNLHKQFTGFVLVALCKIMEIFEIQHFQLS